MSNELFSLASTYRAGQPLCLTAVCSAHPWILKAAIRYAKKRQQPCLIEATCNQVNQDGGYTGMQPIDFVRLVQGIADAEQLSKSNLILGGDHLGPNPWRHLSASKAMAKAQILVAAYAQAGFAKFHLDTSMRCADDPAVLDERVIAERAATLAAVIESVCDEHTLPLPAYVIGTEVPPPGGAAHHLEVVVPTSADSALKTISLHRAQFEAHGLTKAFERVIALVVQPGVEFGDSNVYAYNATKANGLAHVLTLEPAFCFEAHSTDYQSPSALTQLCSDGYSIQKVGPWLTYAYREALYSLDAIAGALCNNYVAGSLPEAMEFAMIENPEYWQHHYLGSANEQSLKRHFSYSDRIRYYWATETAERAVGELLNTLGNQALPEILVSQFLPQHWRSSMSQAITAETVIVDSVQSVLEQYPVLVGPQSRLECS